ncbi:Uncharacterized protein with an alpha/beta hydrolase fold [Alteribacillus persepolensis]|uniref:Uncharacterized protein with an alpha/beta hydrolase fold n=1 Tax=Alteribacillus persepolensis TaxID=568899 RepID=A0A1G8JYS5_9BACI|nr:alpha/beta fold hydrolase [Alteribacillus persepolensis]SDI36325.1 Uncharacterized protein with an alpha/beta hydrolase fold [Alteribacillus persepolensis]
MLSKWRKPNKITLLLTTICSIAIGALLITEEPKSYSQQSSNLTPTLFLHGFKGGPGSFNTMLERFEKNGWGKKEKVFYVKADGTIKTKGTLPADERPFIQVIFENNRASLAEQTSWIQKIMKMLRQTYNVQEVNLVGHSMGGLTSTNFLLHNQKNTYPHVQKLVVMGSPFHGINKQRYFDVNTGEATADLKPDAQSLQIMMNSKNTFDQHVGVLAIAGVTSPTQTDGLVHKNSALGIKHIVPDSNYQEKVFYDIRATHSGLHEHKGVDRTVAAFLWEYDHR